MIPFTTITLSQILKVAIPVVIGTVLPAGVRALRNLGKTREDIAREDLTKALDAKERALADKDPGNDAAAIDEANRKAAALRKVREMRAILDGIGGSEA